MNRIMQIGRIGACWLAFLLFPASVLAMDVESIAIGTEVEDRALLGEGHMFGVSVGTLYCFTHLTGASGKVIRHVWFHEHSEVLNVPLSIGADTWRTWSRKTIGPGMEGKWEVRILGDDDEKLESVSFTVTP